MQDVLTSKKATMQGFCIKYCKLNCLGF